MTHIDFPSDVYAFAEQRPGGRKPEQHRQT